MAKRVFVLLAFVLVMAVFAAPMARPTSAQETTPTTVCDSTLMLLLYIAQHDYGFQSTSDLNIFDRGQYSLWFNNMMAEQAAAGSMEATAEAGDTGAVATAEAGDTGAVATAEAGDTGSTTGSEGTLSATVLNPGVVTGEAAECTALRAELETFFFNEINNRQGGMGAEG